MIIEERKYTEQEYVTLVKQLMVAEDLDAELQHQRQSVLVSNPNFYLMLFRKLNALKDMVKLPKDEAMLPYFGRLESKLYEYTNVFPAELPDSILNDRHLIKVYLADDRAVNHVEQTWNKFQNYIEDTYQSIKQDFRLPFLKWCMAMLNMNYERHKKKCENPEICSINMGYDRRMLFIEKMIEDATPQPTEPIVITIPQSERPGKQANKIQWLGNQKELAELFIMLRAKGWIVDFEIETIKDCFTNSHSIHQYLKPGDTTGTGELGGTFEQVFTSEYVPKFHGMKNNPKKN
jgi:hypothetical protein